MGKKGGNKIPERWEQYSNFGTPISDTKFLALRVPLKEEVVRNKAMPRTAWFTPADFLTQLGTKGLQLGLLIDLTNTDRYYDPKDITYTGVEYVKINVAGQDLPSLKEVKGFFDAVDEYLKRNENGNQLIGVHCTHGVNRTGYMICRYLIERQGWTAKKAVHEFNFARGHRMERDAYLAAIHQAERNFVKSKQAEIDTRQIKMDDETSSSSDEESEQSQQQQTINNDVQSEPPTNLPVAGPQLPTNMPANWQLLQQMMMGVAQMQAMMRMPSFAAGQQPMAPNNATPGANVEEESSDDEEDESGDDEESESDEDDDEDEEDEEESEESSSEGQSQSSKAQSATGAGAIAVGSEEAGNSRQGWELGGKVELKPKMSVAQKRRARRKNVRDEFRKMKRGKFWEIQEMQKKKYGDK